MGVRETDTVTLFGKDKNSDLIWVCWFFPRFCLCVWGSSPWLDARCSPKPLYHYPPQLLELGRENVTKGLWVKSRTRGSFPNFYHRLIRPDLGKIVISFTTNQINEKWKVKHLPSLLPSSQAQLYSQFLYLLPASRGWEIRVVVSSSHIVSAAPTLSKGSLLTFSPCSSMEYLPWELVLHKVL